MVALVAGSGLGLLDSSAFQAGGVGVIGNGKIGTGGGSAYVNVANGNLILQSVDETLSGTGQDLQHLRTYNSGGTGEDGDGDRWRWLGEKRVVVSGNTVIRTTGDGHQSIYNFVSASAGQNTYTSSDGDGADDTITFEGTSWTWEEGTSGLIESYSSKTGWINYSRDTSGNQIDYTFSGDRLVRVEDQGSGQTFVLTYNNNGLLESVSNAPIVPANTKPVGSPAEIYVEYIYDSLNRLAQVSTHLGGKSTNLYYTRYTYDGNSYRIASIVQGDSSVTSAAASYTYVNIAAISGGEDYRVKTVMDQSGTTTFDYDSYLTRVTNSEGNTWTYKYDTHKRIEAIVSDDVGGSSQTYIYTYDDRDNVKSVDDGIGGLINFSYDANSNRTQEVDALGNTIVRVYQDNLLLNETRFSNIDLSEDSAEVNLFIYDESRRLRFVVSPEGRVTETRYNEKGLIEVSIRYAQAIVSSTAPTSTDVMSLAQMTAYLDNLTEPSKEITAYLYDYRGNLQHTFEFANEDSIPNFQFSPYGRHPYIKGDDKSTKYIYSAHGELLQTIWITGTERDQENVLNSFVYDGMGRLISSLSSSGTNIIDYDDGNTKKVVTTNQDSGLFSVSYSDQYGRLLSTAQSDLHTSSPQRTTSYSYDGAGRLRSTTDSLGGRSVIFYDAQGRVSYRVNSAGEVTGYTYENTRVKSETRYATTVSDQDWFTAQALPSSLVVTGLLADRELDYRYDSAGRLTHKLWKSGGHGIEQYFYDATGRLTKVSGRLPHEEAYERYIQRYFYDKDSNLIGQLDGEGYFSEWVFDESGRQVRALRYENTPVDNLLAEGSFDEIKASVVAQNSPALTTYNYHDDLGRVIGHVNEQGLLTVTVFNDSTSPARQYTEQYLTAVSPDANSSLESLIVQAGEKLTVTLEFDNFGRVSRTIGADGAFTENEYDASGRLITMISAAYSSDERVSRTRYNAFGEMTGTLGGVANSELVANPSATVIDNKITTDGIRYVYDNKGLLTQVLDANGHGVYYFYDTENRLTQTINSAGEIKENTYNAFGDVASTRAYSARIDLQDIVDDQSALAALLAALRDDVTDSVMTYSYDYLGRTNLTTDAEGYTTNTYYSDRDLLSSTVQQIDREGSVLRSYFSYDRRDLLATTRQYGDSRFRTTTSDVYDAFGRIERSTDPLGHVDWFVYGDAGRTITKFHNATDDTLSRTTYDVFGRLLTGQKNYQNLTSYSYNDTNNSYSITTPEGSSVTSYENTHGEVTWVVDAEGNLTTYTYTKDGQLDTVRDGEGNIVTDNEYDNAGLLIETKDARGIITRFTYDAANRVTTRVVDPGGLNLQTSYVFDGQGRQISVTEGSLFSSRTTQYEYDRKGQLTQKLVDPIGLKLLTNYDYDGLGNVTRITQGTLSEPEQQVTENVYDGFGRLIETIQDPAGLQLSTYYRYDDADQLTRMIDANGHSIWYVYDAKGLRTHAINAEGEVTQFVYDADNRLAYTRGFIAAIDTANFGDIVENVVTVENRLDNINLNVYDKDNRVRFTLSNNDGVNWIATEQVYDNNNNVIERIHYDDFIATEFLNTLTATAIFNEDTLAIRGRFSSDSILDAALQNADASRRLYQYDGNNRLVSATDALGYVETYTYDAAGNRVSMIDKGGVVTEYAFDSGGRKISVIRDAGGLNIQTQYNYNALNQVTSEVDPSGNKTWFIYDDADRVTYVVNAEGEVTYYEYNNVGQVTSTRRYFNRVDTSQYGNAILFVLVATSTYDQISWKSYDAANRLIADRDRYTNQITYTYDGNGNRLTSTDKMGVVTKSEFDAAGRVTKITRDFGGLNLETSYKYNALGDMIRAIDENDNSTWYVVDVLGQTTEKINATGEVVAYQYDSKGQVYTTHRYYNRVDTTPYGDQILGSEVTENVGKDQVTYTAYDRVGQVRFVATKVSGWSLSMTESVYDGNGNLTEFKRYTGFISNSIFTFNATNGLTDTEISLYLTAYDSSVKTIYQYDSANRKILTTDALGYSESYGYDALGRQITITDKLGVVTQSNFDRIGRLTSVVRDFGGLNLRTEYKYNAFGLTTRKIDANQNSTWFLYDSLGRTASVIDALGGKTDYRYDNNGNVIREYRYYRSADVSNLGDVVSYIYVPGNTSDQVTYTYYDNVNRERFRMALRDENNNYVLTEIRYDALSNIEQEIVYNVNIKGADIQAAGNLFAINTIETVAASADPTKIQSTSYQYNVNGNVTRKTDALGNSESFFYDALGNNTSYTNQLGFVWRYFYDSEGKRTDEVSPRVDLGFFISDTQGLAFGPRMVVNQINYNALGQVTSRVEGLIYINDDGDASGYYRSHNKLLVSGARTTRYEYDAIGRQIKTIHPGYYSPTLGMFTKLATAGSFLRTVEVSYDANGNAIRNKIKTDINSYNYEYKTYDALNREIHSVDSLNYVTMNVYDGGELKQVLRAGNALPELPSTQIAWQADDINLSLGVSTATTGVISIVNSRSIFYNYDALGRKESVSGDTDSVSFIYDSFGNVVEEHKAIDANRTAVYKKFYDRLNRKIFSLDAENFATKTSYDAAGNAIEVTQYVNAVTGSVSQVPPTPTTTERGRTYYYKYDAMNRNIRTSSTGWVSHSDDPSEQWDGSWGETIIESRSYYDAAGQIIRAKNALGNDGATDIEYDALGRIKKIKEPKLYDVALASEHDKFQTSVEKRPVTSYIYDVFGNVTSEERLVRHGDAALNEWAMNDYVSIRKSYDFMGNLIKETDGVSDVTRVDGVDVEYVYPHSDGHVAPVVAQTAGATGFKYDFAGRVISKFQYALNDIDTILTETGYAYDKLGQIVATAKRSETTFQGVPSGGIRYGVEETTYNGFGEITASTRLDLTNATSWNNYVFDPSSRVHAGILIASYQYDNKGRLTEQRGDNGITHYAYNDAGFITEVNLNGQDTFYLHDKLGNVIVETLPSYEGYANGNLQLLTPETIREYDAWGNVVSLTDVLGNTKNYEYNHNNQLYAEIYAPINLSRLDGTSYSSTRRHEYHYDIIGNLVGENDFESVNGGPKQFLRSNQKYYDRSGQYLLREIDETGLAKEYRYDALGNRVATRNGVGTVFVDEYDARGNKLKQSIIRKHANEAYNSFAHDGSTTYQTLLESYEYDAIGRLKTESIYRDTHVSNSYAVIVSTSRGNRKGKVERNYQYDMLNNVIYVTDESGRETGYTFDRFGRKTSKRQARYAGQPGDNIWNYREQWHYKDQDYIADKLSQVLVPGRWVDMSYDTYGRLIQEESTSKNGYKKSYEYNSAGMLTAVEEYFEQGKRFDVGVYHNFDGYLPEPPAGPPAEHLVFHEIDAQDGIYYLKEISRTEFAYDIRGKEVRKHTEVIKESDDIKYEPAYEPDGELESYHVRHVDPTPFVQSQINEFDEQGRLTNLSHTSAVGTLSDSTQLEYVYDVYGNRVKVSGKEGSANAQVTFNAFDLAGRMTIVDGAVVNGEVDIEDGQGKFITYSLAGQRTAEITQGRSHDEDPDPDDGIPFTPYDGYSSLRYYYTDLGYLEATKSEFLRGEYQRNANIQDSVLTLSPDHVSDLVSSAEYDLRGNATYTIVRSQEDRRVRTFTRNDYAEDGQLLSQEFKDWTLPSTPQLDLRGSYEYDTLGNLTQYISLDEGGNPSTFQYEYNYTRAGEYALTGIEVTTGDPLFPRGETEMEFNSFGRLIKTDADGYIAPENKRVSYYHDANGNIIRKNVELDRDTGDEFNYKQYFAFVEGNQVASFGAAATDVFDSGFSSAWDGDPSTGGAYTIRSGDTLMSIAQAYYGDGSLWYLIAERNNLNFGPTDTLSADYIGQSIDITNVITNIHNNADTYRPYRPDLIVDRLMPSSIYSPPLPVMSVNGCAPLKMFLISVVAMIVSIVTAGVTAGAIAGLSNSLVATGGVVAIVPGTAATAGLTAAAVGGTIAAGAVGAFAGSLAGQTMASLMSGGESKIRIQDAFSSAIAGGITAGIGYGLGQIKEVSTIGKLIKGIGGQLVKGAAGYAASYVSNELVYGNKRTFNWAQLAIGAVSSVASGQVRTGADRVIGAPGSMASGFFSNAASGYVSSVLSHNLDDGPKPNIKTIVADAFGNTLGSEVGNGINDSLERIRERKKQLRFERREGAKILAQDKELRDLGVSKLDAYTFNQVQESLARQRGPDGYMLSNEELRKFALQSYEVSQGNTDRGLFGYTRDVMKALGYSDKRVDAELTSLSEGHSSALETAFTNMAPKEMTGVGVFLNSTIGDGMHWVGNAATKIGTNKVAMFGLTAIEIASGPVVYGAKQLILATPVGEALDSVTGEALGAATSYVNEEGQFVNMQRAGGTTVGGIVAISIVVGGSSAYKRVMKSATGFMKNMTTKIFGTKTVNKIEGGLNKLNDYNNAITNAASQKIKNLQNGKKFHGVGDPTGVPDRRIFPEAKTLTQQRELAKLTTQTRDRLLKDFDALVGEMTLPELNALAEKPFLMNFYFGKAVEKRVARQVQQLQQQPNNIFDGMEWTELTNAPQDFINPDGFGFDITGASKSSVLKHQRRPEVNSVVTYESIPQDLGYKFLDWFINNN